MKYKNYEYFIIDEEPESLKLYNEILSYKSKKSTKTLLTMTPKKGKTSVVSNFMENSKKLCFNHLLV